MASFLDNSAALCHNRKGISRHLVAGFLIESGSLEDGRAGPPPKLVDLGECGPADSFSAGTVRATWTYPAASRQVRIYREEWRFLLIEGQPDRYPRENEPLNQWLDGCWGSFRGFEILAGPPAQLTAFVDPLATRPVFFVPTGGGSHVSDKLSTLALNRTEELSPNWPAILEALTLGTLYTTDTSIAQAQQFQPGEVIQFRQDGSVVRGRFEMPLDPELSSHRIAEDPPGTLLAALRRAVAETWVERDSYLLLSGGLDSRLTLSQAGSDRKAMTVTTRENRECRIARDIAGACGARFLHWPRPPEHYVTLLESSFLLTACMWDPLTPHHLGLGVEWRKEGIHEVCNAFLYDTVLKGYFAFPRQKYVSPYLPLHDVLGNSAVIFAEKRSGRSHRATSEFVLQSLTKEARQIAAQRLKELANSMEPAVAGDLDLTLQNRLIGFISRQCHYPLLLGWIEELDVNSPIFHRALWSWARLSPPVAYYEARAFRAALVAAGHPVAGLPDSNTGRSWGRVSRDWRATFRNQAWYPLARTAWRKLRPVSHGSAASGAVYLDEGSWPPLPPLFRTPLGSEALEHGLCLLDGVPLFRKHEVEAILQRFRSGDDAPLEALLSLSALGRWLNYLRSASAGASSGRLPAARRITNAAANHLAGPDAVPPS